MGFVKTTEEIAAMEAAMANPRFVNAEMLSVTFDSDEHYLRSILPAPLTLTAPTVRAMVGRWQSNCVGDFAGGALYVPARVGDLEGEYVLAMYMTTDSAIVYGRELFGEPKKQSAVGLHRGGGRAFGYVERFGVRLLEVEGTALADEGPLDTEGVNFNIKAQPGADGRGMQHDATVTAATFETHLTVNRTGLGRVEVRSTVHDPLGDVPVLGVVAASYVEGDLYASCRQVATIPAADFVPYYYGRIDDWAALSTEPVPAQL